MASASGTTTGVLAGSGPGHLRFESLGLDPVALSLGFFDIKWYSLAYVAGIVVGWWYLTRLIAQPGSPMARRHADDLVFNIALGIILGGRLGYVLFYKPAMLLEPLSIVQLWQGGMSFHGGAIGTAIAIYLSCRSWKIDWLRVLDYVSCVVPFGLFFGRIANFVNGELWGKPTDVSWGIIFPQTGLDVARHPSQLYEAGLEGVVLFAVLAWAFWRTDARHRTGTLTGIFMAGYGVARFIVEFFREPDDHLRDFAATTGLHMGQWLCVPMIALGIWLIIRARRSGDAARPASINATEGGGTIA